MWCQHFICEMKMMIISLGELMTAVKSARKEKRATSIGFHGNIVDVSLCYDAVSDVVESGVHWRSDFQIGSRVLKICLKPILMHIYGMQYDFMHRSC